MSPKIKKLAKGLLGLIISFYEQGIANGGPEGIRTLDLRRDRAASTPDWTAGP